MNAPAPIPPETSPARPLVRRRLGLGTQLVEGFMFATSLTALLMIALIFLFVGREALPIIFGQVNAALVQDVIPVEVALTLPPDELRAYLGLTPGEFARLDHRAVRDLLELRVEAQAKVPDAIRTDPDARANTVSWRYLILPHAWTGYPEPAYVWQPISLIRKYNLVPLLAGSLKIAVIALALAIPASLAAALYVSQFASPRLRQGIKPAIELLSGLPSVVIGFLALTVLAGLLETPLRALAGVLDMPVSRLNALVAGAALAIALVPLIFSIAEDALTAIPRTLAHAAIALGATRWQAATQVVVPAAMPGILAAVILAFGRALGETMIVLMASGNAALLSWNPLEPTRTLSATIAAEMAEAVFGGHHYRMLFLLGLLLLAVTFVCNMAADTVIQRFQRRVASHP